VKILILYQKENKENGKDYAYRVLKDNIMTINLKPGALISEADLSEKLGISRTPIREVLMKLKNEYLIEVKPQTGTYISLIDLDLIDEAVFMRYTLEKEILKEASRKFDQDVLIELQKILFVQKLIVDKKDSAIEFHKLDTEFHRLLFLGVKKQNIWNNILNLSTHYNRMRLLSDIDKDKNYIIKEHEEYLNIIMNNNEENSKYNRNIENIVTKHIKDPIEQWDDLIKNNKEINTYIKK
jgi:DNA-binding GntR family transcriptional regulator